jgi:AcrR family transcriptional regulator
MDQDGGNRAALLSAALTAFSERGYDGVGVAELCDACSVTKPTLYHWFGSKRGLLDAVLAEHGEPLRQAVEAVPYGRDVKTGLEQVALAMAGAASANPGFARLRLALAFAPPASEGFEAGAGLNDALFAAVERFFKTAEKDHGNMKGRSRAYAATFIGTVDTCTALFLAGRGTLGDTVIRGAVKQFMHGIFS